MSELSPQARAALNALGSPEPTAADERRVRDGFERAVGVVLPAAAVVGAVTVGSTAAAASGASSAAMSAGGSAGAGASVASFTALGTGAKVMLFVAAVGLGSVVTVGAQAVVTKPVAVNPIVEKKAAAPRTAKATPGENTRDQAASDQLAANQLAADQLAADQLAADQLAADQLAANQLAADQLAANQLTADQLAANQLTADQLAANQLTADQLAASQLARGEVGADQLAPRQPARQRVRGELARGAQPVTPVSGSPKLARTTLPEVTSEPAVIAPTPSKLSDTPDVLPPAPVPPPTPQSATTEAAFELVVDAHFPSCDRATELRTALAARKLLIEQRAEHALFLIGAYQKHCPSGQWSDEAWRVRLSSLCSVGRNTEAASLFEWFATEYPHRRFAIESELRSTCEPSVLDKE